MRGARRRRATPSRRIPRINGVGSTPCRVFGFRCPPGSAAADFAGGADLLAKIEAAGRFETGNTPSNNLRRRRRRPQRDESRLKVPRGARQGGRPAAKNPTSHGIRGNRGRRPYITPGFRGFRGQIDRGASAKKIVASACPAWARGASPYSSSAQRWRRRGAASGPCEHSRTLRGGPTPHRMGADTHGRPCHDPHALRRRTTV